MKTTKNTTDSNLVIAFQKGDQKAITTLVKNWHYKLCKQAYWYTKDRDVAKDIAQDSWKTIISEIKNLKDPEKFGYWALAIVCRKAIDWSRKTNTKLNKLKEYHHTVNTVATEIYTAEASQKLLKTIKQLPENQQEILHLFYLKEYNLKQISTKLNISKGTVKSRLFYAREKLKTILKK